MNAKQLCKIPFKLKDIYIHTLVANPCDAWKNY